MKRCEGEPSHSSNLYVTRCCNILQLLHSVNGAELHSLLLNHSAFEKFGAEQGTSKLF